MTNEQLGMLLNVIAQQLEKAIEETEEGLVKEGLEPERIKVPLNSHLSIYEAVFKEVEETTIKAFDPLYQVLENLKKLSEKP